MHSLSNMDAWSKYTEYFLTRKVCSKRLRIFIFICRSGNSLLYLINNDVLQYKWPMIGQYYYSFYHWPFTIHTGLSLVFVLYDVILFLLATVSCFICLFVCFEYISVVMGGVFRCSFSVALFCRKLIGFRIFLRQHNKLL